jgi:hypothetical protein
VFASVCHTERIDTHRCVRALVRSSVPSRQGEGK